MPIMKCVASAVLVLATHQMVSGNETGAIESSAGEHQAVVFAVQEEVKVSNLVLRRDVCIGFGQGVEVDQKAILASLKRMGIRMRQNEWCNQGPRGVRVAIVSPINETQSGTFEVDVQVDDLSIHPGQHFASTLRRGTYVIRCEKGSEPKLLSYRETCCPKASSWLRENSAPEPHL